MVKITLWKRATLFALFLTLFGEIVIDPIIVYQKQQQKAKEQTISKLLETEKGREELARELIRGLNVKENTSKEVGKETAASRPIDSH